jgi:phosphohistidine phosphatase SixA
MWLVRVCLVLGLSLGLLVTTANAADTLVVLVRHAEKATDDPRDPGLSPAGLARAQALASAVSGLRLQTVLVTQFQRTQLTAAPAAQAVGVQAVAIAATGEVAPAAAALAHRIRTQHAGQAVLVVGHSNTVGAMVEALGGGAQAPIAEHEYDRLYLLQIPEQGPVRVLQSRY